LGSTTDRHDPLVAWPGTNEVRRIRSRRMGRRGVSVPLGGCDKRRRVVPSGARAIVTFCGRAAMCHLSAHGAGDAGWVTWLPATAPQVAAAWRLCG
jgi:hypothetical protein